MAYSLKLASSHYAIAFLTSTDHICTSVYYEARKSVIHEEDIMKADIQCYYVCLFFNWQLPSSCVTSSTFKFGFSVGTFIK